MVKINLIGKKRRHANDRNWVIVISLIVFSIFTIYFLSVSIMVFYRLYATNNEQIRVDKEAEMISKEMTSNNQLLQGFVLSKYILTEIRSLNLRKFPYSLYLDQLANFLPANGVLKNVDFSKKGFVSVVASFPGGKELKQFENRLTDATIINESGFSSIYSLTFSKDVTGFYNAKLEFEIRNNAGN